MSSSAVEVGSLRDRLARAARGVWWYLREVTGEAKWDAYLDRCEQEGRAPMSRRDYERHRADHKERTASGRCC